MDASSAPAIAPASQRRSFKTGSPPIAIDATPTMAQKNSIGGVCAAAAPAAMSDHHGRSTRQTIATVTSANTYGSVCALLIHQRIGLATIRTQAAPLRRVLAITRAPTSSVVFSSAN